MTAKDDRRNVLIKYCEETVLSAAQNNEDVLLYRALRGKQNGSYIDIGAGDPNWDSVTNWFYRIGWRGINIEPSPNAFESLQQWRPDEINLNVGVSDTPGVLVFRQVLADKRGWGWGLSSFVRSVEKAAREAGFDVKKMPVPVTTLTHIVETYCAGRSIDFLKIDVEGFERPIILSTDWRTIRPTVLCIEATD